MTTDPSGSADEGPVVAGVADVKGLGAVGVAEGSRQGSVGVASRPPPTSPPSSPPTLPPGWSPPRPPRLWPPLPPSPRGRLAGLVALSAVLFDLWVRAGWGIGASLWAAALILVVGEVVTSRARATTLRGMGESTSIPRKVRLPSLREVLVPLCAAAGVAGLFSLRASLWLVPLNLLAVLGLAGVAVIASHGEDPWQLDGEGAVRWVGRAVEAMVAATFRSAQLGRQTIPSGGASALRRTLRTAAVVAPVLVVVGALLVSADALVASYLSTDIEGVTVASHVGLIVVGIWIAVAAALPTKSSSDKAGLSGTAPVGCRLFTPSTAAALFRGLVVLFGGFVITNLFAAAGGDTYIQQRTGLTYAQYARQGFFQLLVVAAITLTLLVTFRRRVRVTLGLRILVGAVVLLIGAVVAIALVRLHLYERAYGATMLRLYSTWFAWWLAALFLPVGLAWMGLLPGRAWVGRASAALTLGWLVGVNVINPEAMVARRNLDHAERTGILDLAYLSQLGPDATPALLAGLDRLRSGPASSSLRARLCEGTTADSGDPSDSTANFPAEDSESPNGRAEGGRTGNGNGQGWLGWSWSRHQASVARSIHC